MPEDAVKLKKQETVGTQSGDSHLVCAELGPGSGADGSRGTCAGKPPLPPQQACPALQTANCGPQPVLSPPL